MNDIKFVTFDACGRHKQVTRKWVTFEITNGTGFIGWSRWGYVKAFVTDEYLRYYVYNSKHKLLYWLSLKDNQVKAKNLNLYSESLKIGLPNDPNPYYLLKPLIEKWLTDKLPFRKEEVYHLTKSLNLFTYPFLTNSEAEYPVRLVKRLVGLKSRTQAAKQVFMESGKLACSMMGFALRYYKATMYAVNTLGLKPQDLSLDPDEYEVRCLLGRTNKSVKRLPTETVKTLIGFNKPIKFKEFQSESSLKKFTKILIELLKGGDYHLPVSPSWERLEGALVPNKNSTLVEWGKLHGICIGGYGNSIAGGKRSCAAIMWEGKTYFLDVVNKEGGVLTQVRSTYNEDAPWSLKVSLCEKLSVKGEFEEGFYRPKVVKPFVFPKLKKQVRLTLEAFKALNERAYYLLNKQH